MHGKVVLLIRSPCCLCKDFQRFPETLRWNLFGFVKSLKTDGPRNQQVMLGFSGQLVDLDLPSCGKEEEAPAGNDHKRWFQSAVWGFERFGISCSRQFEHGLRHIALIFKRGRRNCASAQVAVLQDSYATSRSESFPLCLSKSYQQQTFALRCGGVGSPPPT